MKDCSGDEIRAGDRIEYLPTKETYEVTSLSKWGIPRIPFLCGDEGEIDPDSARWRRIPAPEENLPPVLDANGHEIRVGDRVRVTNTSSPGCCGTVVELISAHTVKVLYDGGIRSRTAISQESLGLTILDSTPTLAPADEREAETICAGCGVALTKFQVWQRDVEKTCVYCYTRAGHYLGGRETKRSGIATAPVEDIEGDVWERPGAEFVKGPHEAFCPVCLMVGAGAGIGLLTVAILLLAWWLR